MKRPLVLVLVIAIAVAVYAGRHSSPDLEPTAAGPSLATTAASAPSRAEEPADDGSLARAIAAHAEDVAVTGHGMVLKLLADDREGSPHQRIVLRVPGGTTVLIAHNLELAAPVEPLAVGDELEFSGEYVWNEKGGVVHWTHPDPRGHHRAGWIHRLGR
ncbi:MAG: DUF3465 domain-containing protein [Arenimonas sp.]